MLQKTFPLTLFLMMALVFGGYAQHSVKASCTQKQTVCCSASKTALVSTTARTTPEREATDQELPDESKKAECVTTKNGKPLSCDPAACPPRKCDPADCDPGSCPPACRKAATANNSRKGQVNQLPVKDKAAVDKSKSLL
jgi:hypothetical protein